MKELWGVFWFLVGLIAVWPQFSKKNRNKRK